eukprot:CAMPEP_0115863540 /NCGR_PEP_ID=MMETSP0287-20121206/18740_1 /TAXON_ID=412157 /ORGANISM="Chrysochromulina rotalis, Strain UIO044" /LENGTH=136 /DNA_ID=CAMNT_0003317987 /DNA_START=219 /DNA_END=630 /DNA_ORIENTATION=-
MPHPVKHSVRAMVAARLLLPCHEEDDSSRQQPSDRVEHAEAAKSHQDSRQRARDVADEQPLEPSRRMQPCYAACIRAIEPLHHLALRSVPEVDTHESTSRIHPWKSGEVHGVASSSGNCFAAGMLVVESVQVATTK